MGLKMDEIIKTINKEAKENIASRGIVRNEVQRIPFTSARMNYCTFGGLPMGKLIEFFGEEHGGKTTTALDIVANYQQLPDARDVAWFDCENTLDLEWANKLGVDTDNMYIFKPTSQSAEEIFQIILNMIDSGELGLFVIDSIGVLVSAAELEKTMDQKTYAGISGPLTVFGRKAEMLMQRHNCTGIGINQIRDDLSAMWGGAIKTPGGRGWKHVCAVRLQFSKGNYIDENGKELKRSAENPVGNVIMMNMVKNKTCPPTRRVGYYTINYMTGVDYVKDLVDVGIKFGCIDKRGAWFSIIDPDTGEIWADNLQGISKVFDLLNDPDSEDVLVKLEKFVNDKIYLE